MSDPGEGPDVDESRLLEHDYDGIREYDNPLPGWWRAGFWATIVFAAGYGLYFQVLHLGKTPDEVYRVALAEYDSRKVLRETADAANVSEDILAKKAGDSVVLDHGAMVFAGRCVACHTDNGRGLIGPNLTDLFQIHGSTRMDIYKTVHDGAPGTPMLAWGEQMPPNDVLAVAAFVTTLRGKNIPGKQPQGQPVQRFSP